MNKRNTLNKDCVEVAAAKKVLELNEHKYADLFEMCDRYREALLLFTTQYEMGVLDDGLIYARYKQLLQE